MDDALAFTLSQTEHILKSISSYEGSQHQMVDRLNVTVTSLLGLSP